jgi:cell wall-associated NlpC family hydrolase
MKKPIAGLMIGMMAFSISILTTFADHQSTTGFADVSLTDWHAGYVLTLSNLDVIRGYSDSTFQPKATISKAEFIVLAIKSQQIHFPSAEGEHWAMNYIRHAEVMEALDEGEAASLAPNEPITRAEATRILIRIADPQQQAKDQDLTNDRLAIKDFYRIPDTYQPYVLRAFANGWVSGYPDGEFKPEHHITRAEASVMLTKSLGDEAEEQVELVQAMAKEIRHQQEEQREALRESILEAATALLGTPYRYGGSTPAGFDCSGFVGYVLEQHGIDVPRSSAAMYRAVEQISFDELEPGDLVFFRGYQPGPSHVGIYVGDGEFIHAPSTGRTVSFDKIDDPSYWGRRQIGAARVL